ncbi:MAG: riboflavin biosynthesis protein RibF [Lentisphaerae bacterium]|nr:riboflavin biosynthesis protein RibF [Lentisphaerota bacterium]
MENFIEFAGKRSIPDGENFIVALGVFDGVHLGHQLIIRQASARAAASGAKVLALSFHPHPRQLLTPDQAPELLITRSRRVELLGAAGADVCGFINFTRSVAGWEPEDFLEKLRDVSGLRISGICVGKQWRFGRQGRGSREVLAAFCQKNRWSFDAVEELTVDGVTVSSSAIRTAVAEGRLEYARAMLGRDAELAGVVVPGHQIAGKQLAAPTANLQLEAGVLVPDGVYCGIAEVDGREYKAVLNIGFAPTFGGDPRRIEVHLLDFSGEIYSHPLRVSLCRFLREERKFSSPEELKKQIFQDIVDAGRFCRLQKK